MTRALMPKSASSLFQDNVSSLRGAVIVSPMTFHSEPRVMMLVFNASVSREWFRRGQVDFVCYIVRTVELSDETMGP